ncbi:hypothetical protein D3C75_398420 [compost metagenome]
MDALAEELKWIVPGLPLHILRQRNRDCPGICLISQHTHRVQQCCHQLLWPINPVPIFAHRFEGIVDRYRQIVGMLHLLKYRIRLTGGKGIAGEQQHGNLIRRRSGSGCQHIG